VHLFDQGTIEIFRAVQLKNEHLWQLIDPGDDATVNQWLTLRVFKPNRVGVLIFPCFQKAIKLLHLQLVVEEVIALFFCEGLACLRVLV